MISHYNLVYVHKPTCAWQMPSPNIQQSDIDALIDMGMVNLFYRQN